MSTNASTRRQVSLTKEKETLLITLYAKAQDFRSPHSLLGDRTAERVVQSLEYDFSKFNGAGNDNLTVVRARQFDDWIRDYLDSHANAVVLYLGCGLDTRFQRIDPSDNVAWYDVDYPEVIALRQEIIAPMSEPRVNYTMLGSSVTADGWLEGIPGDRPTLIAAEGLLEYLTEADVKTLLNRLTNHFQQGVIIFDVMNSFAVNAGKKQLQEITGATHTWAVDDTRIVAQLDPRLRSLTDLSVMELPAIGRLTWQYRALYMAMRAFPQFRGMIRVLRYEF